MPTLPTLPPLTTLITPAPAAWPTAESPALARRRGLLGAAAALAVAGLAGCAGLGGPTVLTLREDELNTLVGRVFPQQRRVLELLEVEASAPQLSLQAERNRLAMTLQLAVRERLTGRRQTGQLAFDSALRYDSVDPSLRLQQVRVQALALDGARPEAELPLRLGRVLAEQWLENLAVWRPGADRLERLRVAGVEPGAVTVTARGVEVTLARLAR